MARLILIIPLLLLFVLVFFFVKGLYQDPHILPSTFINQPAPNFQLSSLKKTNDLYDQSVFQKKTTLLIFWASWCESCVDEENFLLKLRETYPDLQLIGVDEKDDRKNAIQWLKTNGNPFDIVLQDSPQSDMAINYGVYGTPETFLIDANGTIIAKQVGALTEENFKANILPALTH